MEPVTQNILSMLLTFAYIKIVIACCDWAVDRGLISLLVSRKTVHIAASFQPFFWNLFDTSHWTWTLNSAPSIVFAIQLFVKGWIIGDPNDDDVRTMSRTGKPIELCQGPLFFVLVLNYVNLFEFKKDLATYVMAAMGFGDGLAPIIGIYHPFGYYRIGGGVKTVSGSTGVFVGTLIGIFVFRSFTGAPETVDFNRIIGVSVAATIGEALSGKWDNIVIPACVFVYLQAMSMR